jgi:basic membrane lipoprotein Med (substrate-binding protein (PBP1-ABC) superfamily)
MAAFAGNNLTEIVLPEGLISIDVEAFGANALTEVSFPSSIQLIDRSAFNRNQIENLTFLNGLIDIGEGAFEGNKIETFRLPDTLISIGERAFFNNKIEEVEIPRAVSNIGREAFGFNPITRVLIQGDSSRFDSQRYLIGLPFDHRLVYLRSSGMENAQQFHINNTIKSIAQRNNVSYGEVIINPNPDFSYQTELFVLKSSPITQLIVFDASDRIISDEMYFSSQLKNNKFLISLNAMGEINYYNDGQSIALGFKSEEIGFIAGYVAVVEGNASLAVINDYASYMNIHYAIGFVAGAYHAADLLNRNITLTVDLSSNFISDEFGNPYSISDSDIRTKANNLYLQGHELIYALYSQRHIQPVIDAAESNDGKLILSSSNQFNLSDRVITTIEPDYSDYLEILLNQYLRGTLRSNSNILKIGASENAITINNDFSRLNTYDSVRHNTLIQSIVSGNVTIPSNPETLTLYLESLGISSTDIISHLYEYYWRY